MSKLYGLCLILGTTFLYSGMSCIYIPSYYQPLKPKSNQISNIVAMATDALTNKESNADSKSEYENHFSDIDSTKVVVDTYSSITMPEVTRGLYLSNNTIRSKKRMAYFLKASAKYKVNTFVIDVQGAKIPKSRIEEVKKAGIFPVGRIVVFHGGLAKKYPPKGHIDKILAEMVYAANLGFKEVQLDYIRYADYERLRKLKLKFKYGVIAGILKRAAAVARREGLHLSADLFGRITLNRHDHIGQRLELFARYVGTIYPMVYPSHYTHDSYRINHPYFTVKEGVLKSRKRVPRTRIVAYIQGFKMKIQGSGLSLSEYVRHQIKATEDARGQGWVVWNPRNTYGASFEAMARHAEVRHKKHFTLNRQNEFMKSSSVVKKKPLHGSNVSSMSDKNQEISSAIKETITGEGINKSLELRPDYSPEYSSDSDL